MGANPEIEPTTSQRAFNRQERPPTKRTGAWHHRDYRIVFASGVDLEITNCRSPGLARLLAVDFQRSKGRSSDAGIVRIERLPDDPWRHEERTAEARGQRL